MRFLSLFSGIEAASWAWLPIGWTCVAVAEVDKSARRVLKAKYPEVPNLGDITKITQQDIEALGHLDIVVYGFPCQDLSIAGKRAGMKGERSGLFFDAVRIIRWSRARFALFENVPGLFSSEQGRDFAAVVGALTGLECDVPEDGWRNTGVAAGPLGLLEWSVLDAQWFGVPQRRRRIFALSDFGDWAGRSPILFDAESLSGNTPPRRETRQDVTGTLGARTSGGGGLGTDFDLGGGYELSPALTGSGRGTERAGDSRGQDCVIPILEPGCRTGASTDDPRAGIGIGEPGDPMFTLQAGKQHGVFASTGETSHCLNAGGMGRIDYETETLIASTLKSNNGGGGFGSDPSETFIPYVTHALRVDGFDASEDGTGRGTPLIPIPFDTTQITSTMNRSNPRPGDPCHPLAAGAHPPAVAFQSSQSGVRESEVHATLDSNNGSRRHNGVIQGPAVRRLTPLECTRLQGFSDDYFTGMKLADGPIYKMLGNSMAVPVMRWIGQRIQTEVAA